MELELTSVAVCVAIAGGIVLLIVLVAGPYLAKHEACRPPPPVIDEDDEFVEPGEIR